MKTAVIACALGVVGAAHHHREQHHLRSGAKVMAMSELAPFYHSTEDIRGELSRLSTSCPGMTLQSMGDDPARAIDVVTIKGSGSTPVNKNFLLFGEHSRELISPESGLHFVKALCGENEGLKERAQQLLQDNEYQIVVNGNPGSRSKVEQGSYCLRVSPGGVDLNRNWDEEWQPGAVLDSVDTNPGPKPFSEPETVIFKELVSSYRPTTFLTIHSGTKGMYMPWAYDMEHLASRNEPQMMEILKKLDKDHCECPFGAAGREVGYSCPGTCLDWIYDKLQTQYAFAFEIYVGNGEEELKERWEEKMRNGPGAFYQLNSNLAHKSFKEIFEKHPSGFVQLKSQTESAWERSEMDCFSQFNPSDEEDYKRTIENWSRAYFDMSALVTANLKSSAPGASNATAAGAMAFADV